MRTKGQAALEFLMTYGWAILIVIAVVAALYAMGVFQLPSGGLSKCSPCFGAGSGLAYVDHNANSLVVRVGPAPVSHIFTDLNATVDTNGYQTGADITIRGPFSDVSAQAGRTVVITYTDDNSGLVHTASVTLHGG